MQIVTGQDDAVASWMFSKSGVSPVPFIMAIGLRRTGEDTFCGGFMFTGYDGASVEVHFFGLHALRPMVVRALFAAAVTKLNASKMTVNSIGKPMARFLAKLGAVHERGDLNGDRFAFSRDRMEEIARLGE